MRASVLASLTSFFVFDSVIILSRQGFATYVLKPIPLATSSIHLQCVPVSNARAADRSCLDRDPASPSLVVGIFVSITALGLPPSALAITQTWIVRSLTSIPIVV